jgi:hypothetical protein
MTEQRAYLTKYGFTWGPMDVFRACAAGRYKTVLIRTPYAELQISVSPTGKSIRTHQQRTRSANK